MTVAVGEPITPERDRWALGSIDIRTVLRPTARPARVLRGLGRRLDLAEHDVMAVQHLAHAGELTPTQLARRLRLTSGGATALVQRLERRGFVARTPHPVDGRSTCLRLTAEIEALAGDALAPMVADVEAALAELEAREAAAVARFLAAVAEIAERHADELVRRADREDAANRSSGAAAPALLRPRGTRSGASASRNRRLVTRSSTGAAPDVGGRSCSIVAQPS